MSKTEKSLKSSGAVTIIEAIRQGIHEEMTRDETVFVIGEDIGAYGNTHP